MKIEIEITPFDYPPYEIFSHGETVRFGDYEINHGTQSIETGMGKTNPRRIIYTVGPYIPFDLRCGRTLSEESYEEAKQAIENSRIERLNKTINEIKAQAR